MSGMMGGMMMLYGIVWLLVVGVVVVALWRGMRALERIAERLGTIERHVGGRTSV